MKVALEFLPRLRLNKILTSFALNELVFSFFSFNFFLYYFDIVYLFFVYHFYQHILLYLRIQFHQCWFMQVYAKWIYAGLLAQKIVVGSRNFGHLVYNQQNCMFFNWYYCAEGKQLFMFFAYDWLLF